MQLNKFGLVAANLFFVFTFCLNASAAPADFDLTFGNGGKVVSSPDGSETTRGLAYALQTDGKIIAVGGGSISGFIVARYNANGSLDTTFGTNGWSSITFADYSTSASAIDIQADGKIVVGGTVSRFVNNLTVADFAVARFNSNGSIDTTFDGDGKTTISFVPEIISFQTASENFRTLKVTSDGKIIAGGSAGIPGPGGNSRFAFARLNTDGSLDTTFDGDGKLLGVQGFMYLNDLTVLPDGSIIGVGSEVNDLLRLASKYNSDGTFAWSYAVGETLPGGNGLHGIAQQPDGKLVMVGNRRGRFYALRLTAGGSEDGSFAAPNSPSGRLNSVAVMPDGKIVATLNLFGFNIVRYNSDGNFDTSFGSGGTFTTAVSGGTDFPNKIIAQPDGKILVGGYSELSNPSRNYFSMLRLLGSAAAPRTRFDYDGDGKADVSVYRPSDGYWYILQSSNGGYSFSAFGQASDNIVPADYDGDGRTDIAVQRGVNWYALRSRTNTFFASNVGQSGDIPVPGNYDGDIFDDIAVYRNGMWTYRVTGNDTIRNYPFGTATDKPVAGDYDGDGKTDYAFYRPSDGTWNIRNSSNFAITVVNFGLSDDKPIPADYDGDGKTDIAVYRPSVGDWYYLKSSDGSFTGVHWGISGDKPVAADYDGDGKTDIAVFRPSDGAWYINQSTAGFKAVQWGVSTDIPTPAAYNR